MLQTNGVAFSAVIDLRETKIRKPPLPGQSGNPRTFDAICNQKKCNIILDETGIRSPEGFIPAHRIAYWQSKGSHEHNMAAANLVSSGGAVLGSLSGALTSCWSLNLLCPAAIIGGYLGGGLSGAQVGRSADYHFHVIGYNLEGKKITKSFSFVNEKPISRLKAELVIFSGLKSGELRPITEIRTWNKRTNQVGSGLLSLPPKL